MQLPIDDEDEMRLPKFHLGQDLALYLTQIRQTVFSKTEHRKVTVVLGNQSCDLDSFICAFSLSYFYNARSNITKHHNYPIYIPVLNLPYVEAAELWRLRPEFGVAIRGAFDGLTPQSDTSRSKETTEADQQREKTLLEQLITIHELANNEDTIPVLKHAFTPSGKVTERLQDEKLDVILVDHNAPAIETITDEDLRSRLHAVGVIDHHVEEDYVPERAEPRIVRLGIGSCMSLVAEHLRKLNLWEARKNDEKLPGFQQISRLSLTPILVDTWNLQAPGDKVSNLDREQVAFLDPQTGDDFNPDDLFEQAQSAKSESANLLTMQEIFARDYKSYDESTRDEDCLNIGIASVVKDLAWLSAHAKGKQKLADEIVEYAQYNEKKLELFGILTRSGDRKEVCIFSFGDHGKRAIGIFEENAGELKLEEWEEDNELSQIFNKTIGENAWKVWWMGDTSKSRKQVAPLLRDALNHT